MFKHYQIFCKIGERSFVGETQDVSEKGMSVLSNIDAQCGDSVEIRIVPQDEIFTFTCVGTVQHAIEQKEDEKYKYRIGISFVEGLKDFAMDQLVGGHDQLSARKSLVINAAPEFCFEAICDFESYPQWQKVINSASVLKRLPDGRPEVVEFSMDAILKKIKFVNKYEYLDRDLILSWKAAGGDIKTNNGSYVFKSLRDGKTNAVFSLEIELGFYAPKRVLDYLNNISMRNSIRALKEVIESGQYKKIKRGK